MGEAAGPRPQDTGTATPGKCKSCSGILYFSSAINNADGYPKCVGYRSRDPKICPDLQPVQVPGADFKYFCVGYSLYDEELIRQNRTDRSSSADPVDLPHCEGLEIVSAAHVQASPVLSGVGPAGAESSAATQAPSAPTSGLARGRAYGGVPPPTRTEIDLTELPDKFVKSSQRVLERMVTNAKAMKAAAVSAWRRISRRDRNGS